MTEPFISICIPAYKKPEYVVRCLESIRKQDFKQLEVIISDDSPGEDIKHVIESYGQQLQVRYFHNRPALKSPANWNAALQKARGDYLLLLHQDDWLHAPDCLSSFVKCLREKNVDFVFCQNTAIDEQGRKKILQGRPGLVHRLKETPNRLLLAQVIGPPSNTMLRKTVDTRYDERFIWLVDVDYYTRMLKKGYTYCYIERHLVSIGLHADQTTVFCRENPDVIFRENIWYAGKLEKEAFNDPLIFDYYWRLLRNNRIRSMADILSNGVAAAEVPPVIRHMLAFQEKLSLRLLQIGPLSKILMLRNYVSWKQKNRS